MKSIAILGGTKIGQRPWRPGKKVWSIAILGGSEMDFRQAQLEEEVTEVVAFSFLGGTKIIVPRDVPVTLSGFSILGGRDVKAGPLGEAPPPATRALHINAISILGGCTVTQE